jgi:aerotolerance regulator-like protein/VWA domain-containing protein
MTFVFPILLGGLAVAGIPILLHLILRQKPKTLPFPAFRFLVQRHRSNLRKLQLRHVLLLILRVLLIAAICLALARPRLVNDAFNLSRERPVAAILVVDTSPSMDYQTSDKVSRLDEAKKRGKELLGELPDGSRVLILDTAESVVSDRGDWLTSPSQIQQRLDNLKVKSANSPVTRSLEQALRIFHTASRGEDEGLRQLPRLLCVFSDRTVASWLGGKQQAVHDLADQLPATLEGVQQLRSGAAPLLDLLKGLRAKLPPPTGKDYPDTALAESVEALRDRSANLDRDALQTDPSLQQLLVKARRQARDLRDALVELGEQKAPETEEFRTKALANLYGLMRRLAGVRMLYLDVGVEQPVDLALLQLEFPRLPDGQMQQAFAADDRFVVRVLAQALGKDISAAVACRVNTQDLAAKQVELKAGARQTVPFEIDLAKLKLEAGDHALEVHYTGKDALENNNRLFATFRIRQSKRVLLLADDQKKPEFFAKALRFVGCLSEVKTLDALPALKWTDYDAVYLFELASPPTEVWQAAEAYVQKGGGVAIVPGRDEMKPAAYNQPAAQTLLPVAWKDAMQAESTWDMSPPAMFQHPFLKPFRLWFQDETVDFIAKARRATRYWQIVPDPKKTAVIVGYADQKHTPALLERLPSGPGGKVVAFTTPLDDLEPHWNNYAESLTSFPLALAMMTTRYLTGEDKAVRLNFSCGVEEPQVLLPPAPRFPSYVLRGVSRGAEAFETLTTDGQANVLRIKQMSLPGNYRVEGPAAAGQPGPVLAGFSLNLPPEEGDLTRVPATEIESVFGDNAVIAPERQASLHDLLQGQWSEPLELFPYLMVLLLFVLALENLLANKFYRREE